MMKMHFCGLCTVLTNLLESQLGMTFDESAHICTLYPVYMNSHMSYIVYLLQCRMSSRGNSFICLYCFVHLCSSLRQSSSSFFDQ